LPEYFNPYESIGAYSPDATAYTLASLEGIRNVKDVDVLSDVAKGA
jgi:hypothetical protein